MVSLKLAPLKVSFLPLKNAMSSRGKGSVRKVFKHVDCSDEQLVGLYFRDGDMARASLKELSLRSWEYQYEFAVEMSKRCQQVMGKDPDMIEAYEVYEQWYLYSGLRGANSRRIEDHGRARGRRFPLLPDTIFLANLYPRAQRHVISDEALEYALAYCLANTNKKPLHHILVDKSNPFGLDLLSQRQKALEKLVPRRLDDVELYEWDCDYQGRLMKVPSRVQ